MKAMPLVRFIGPIFLLALFLSSCGDDGSGVSNSVIVEESSSSAESSNSKDLDKSSSSIKNEGSSSSTKTDESSSSKIPDESSSSDKPVESSSSMAKSSSSEISSSSIKIEESSSSVESSSSEKPTESSSSTQVSSNSANEGVRSSSSTQVSSSSANKGVRSSSSTQVSSSSANEDGHFSSSTQSSSSLVTVEMCKTGTEDYCEYGRLVDNRDGKSYRTVKIGEQEWMAENLAYECDSLRPWNRSVCHHDPDTCAKYGRWYFWGAAMDSLKTGCGNGIRCSPQVPVRGICPKGWHIPSRREIEILLKNVGNASGLNLRTTNSWTKPRKCNGNDGFGFSALPAGYFIGGASSPYARINTEADILLSDEYDKNQFLILQIIGPASVSGCNKIAEIYPLWNKSDAVSVRCIKD